MRKITTTLKTSKKLRDAAYKESHKLPLSPHENLKKLNISQSLDPEDPLSAFKHDFFTWIRAKNPNVVERKLTQALQIIFQKKYPAVDREKMQYILAVGFKADLHSKVIIDNFRKTGILITADEFNQIFLNTLSMVEFNNRAKYLKETAFNYSQEVIKFGFKLLRAAIFHGKQKELINAGKPEINLSMRDGKAIIACSFKGPLGIRKSGPPAVFELIPLPLPFEIEMQWLPKTGWTFHLPNTPEYQKLYEKLGIAAIVKFSTPYKKEIISGSLGLSLSGISWMIRDDIDFSASLTLAALGGVAMLASGISSCIKHQKALVE